MATSGVLCLGGAAGLPGPSELVSASDYPEGAAPGGIYHGRGDAIISSEPTDGQASVTVVADNAAQAAGFVVPTSPSPGVVTQTLASGLGIPGLALEAYQSAAAKMTLENPSCGIRWEILAGIGKIESGHANGGQVAANGDVQPRIVGPALDGNGFASIGDSDGGRWDGDAVWDRAVGPMQFIPGTWKTYGVDGNGDGQVNPHNIFDATLAAAEYLCASGNNLATDDGLRSALFRYNPSTTYVDNVMAWIRAYDNGSGYVTQTPGPGPEGPPPPPPSSDAPNPSGSPRPTPPPGSNTPDPDPTPTTPPPSGDVNGGGDVSGGDVSGGDVSGGDATGGDATGGDATGGDATGGDATGGDVTGGAEIGTELGSDDGAADGGAADGGAADGGAADGGAADGGAADGGAAEGGAADGGAADGGAADGGAAESGAAESGAAEGGAAEGGAADGGAAESGAAEGGTETPTEEPTETPTEDPTTPPSNDPDGVCPDDGTDTANTTDPDCVIETTPPTATSEPRPSDTPSPTAAETPNTASPAPRQSRGRRWFARLAR